MAAKIKRFCSSKTNTGRQRWLLMEGGFRWSPYPDAVVCSWTCGGFLTRSHHHGSVCVCVCVRGSLSARQHFCCWERTCGEGEPFKCEAEGQMGDKRSSKSNEWEEHRQIIRPSEMFWKNREQLTIQTGWSRDGAQRPGGGVCVFWHPPWFTLTFITCTSSFPFQSLLFSMMESSVFPPAP